jgi:hypothetical protein
MENETYTMSLLKINGNNYVLYHDDESNHMHGSLHVSTKINFENRLLMVVLTLI